MAYSWRQRPCTDLRQRDKCPSFPHPSILDEVLTDLLVLNDNIVQFSTTSDFKGCSLIEVFLRERDQLYGNTFHLPSIEVGRRIFVLEIEPRHARPDPFSPLHRN